MGHGPESLDHVGPVLAGRIGDLAGAALAAQVAVELSQDGLHVPVEPLIGTGLEHGPDLTSLDSSLQLIDAMCVDVVLDRDCRESEIVGKLVSHGNFLSALGMVH